MILFKTIHINFIDSWFEYKKTNSYRKGARWNHPHTPVMYTSSNVQNAMLELANYVTSPKMANLLYRIVLFEFPELRLHRLEPNELPDNWADNAQKQELRDLGDSFLNNPALDGMIVPSVTINQDIATHSKTDIRSSSYANVIVNLSTVGTQNIKLLNTYAPIYSRRMFLEHLITKSLFNFFLILLLLQQQLLINADKFISGLY